ARSRWRRRPCSGPSAADAVPISSSDGHPACARTSACSSSTRADAGAGSPWTAPIRARVRLAAGCLPGRGRETREDHPSARRQLSNFDGIDVLRIRSGAIHTWRLPPAKARWCTGAARRTRDMDDTQYLAEYLIRERLREAEARGAVHAL